MQPSSSSEPSHSGGRNTNREPRFSVLQPVEHDISEMLPHLRSQIPAPEPNLATVNTCLQHPITGLPRTKIPVCEPTLNGNERKYVLQCLDSGWISSAGAFIKRFEADFATFCGVDHAISCSSGTTALHLALTALGIGVGDEVIVPTFAMIAVANAVRYCGATPVLVDVDPNTYNIDPSRVAAALSPRTKGIIVVHTYGHPADMTALLKLAEQLGLFVLEDAAEAHGARIGDVKVGSLGHAGVFSFYGNKTLTTGEGGMVVTSDPQLASTMRTLRDHAFSEERHFWHKFIGFNYRMTNLQAAVGVAQIERADDLINARRRNACLYNAALREIMNLRLPIELPGYTSTFWMYGVEVQPPSPVSRDQLRLALAKLGIETRSYFIPIHLQPIYYSNHRDQQFPVAERLCGSGLYLPSSSSLGESEITYIADCVTKAMTPS